MILDGLTQPRSELFAATMNSHTGELVKRAFQSNQRETGREGVRETERDRERDKERDRQIETERQRVKDKVNCFG